MQPSSRYPTRKEALEYLSRQVAAELRDLKPTDSDTDYAYRLGKYDAASYVEALIDGLLASAE